MTLTLPADVGEPMSAVLVAGTEVKHHEFPALTRQVSLRNTGTNTLWLSLDEGQCWFTEFAIEAPVEGVVSWLRPCGDTIEADDVVAILDV